MRKKSIMILTAWSFLLLGLPAKSLKDASPLAINEITGEISWFEDLQPYTHPDDAQALEYRIRLVDWKESKTLNKNAIDLEIQLNIGKTIYKDKSTQFWLELSYWMSTTEAQLLPAQNQHSFQKVLLKLKQPQTLSSNSAKIYRYTTKNKSNQSLYHQREYLRVDLKPQVIEQMLIPQSINLDLFTTTFNTQPITLTIEGKSLSKIQLKLQELLLIH